MTYRAGIIGAGGIAGMGILGMHDEERIGREKIRASHAGGFRARDSLELVAVADLDDEKLHRFGDAWDIPPDRLYTDHEEMLRTENLDVVSVCTPTMFHADHVIDAAEVAAPDVVWCEKPIASSLSDAQAMVEACDAASAELVINHSFRFTDKLQRLHRLIHQENLLGEIEAVSAQFRMELLRNSTHLLDTLVYLLDARADRVSGYLTGENGATDALDAGTEVTDSGGGGFVVMEDGTFVTIDCTIPRDISSMSLQFIGTEGKLYMNNDDGEWRYWTLRDGEHVEQPIPGIEGAWTWDDDYQESFANAARNVESILSGTTENHSPGVDAVRSLEIIIGFYISYYTGSTVSIPLKTPLESVEVTSW
jgi:predicted dehydrogenase